MGIAEIIALLAALTSASREILMQFNQLAGLFQKMHDEGRTTMTPEEEAQMVQLRDQARAALQAAINVAP